MSRWNRFVKDGIVINKEKNTKYDFKKMCKIFGKEYIEYLRASWETNCLPEKEFLIINGNVPQDFFNKYIKAV